MDNTEVYKEKIQCVRKHHLQHNKFTVNFSNVMFISRRMIGYCLTSSNPHPGNHTVSASTITPLRRRSGSGSSSSRR